MNKEYFDITYRGHTLDITNKYLSVSVPRVKNGINFLAAGEALKKLSADAFALYMFMIRNSENSIWKWDKDKLIENTSLNVYELNVAVIELLNTGYMTFQMPDENFGTIRSFHIWEKPSLNPDYMN